MTLRDWGMILLLALLWGGAFFFIEIAVAELGPFTIALCRVFFAALGLSLWGFVVGDETLWANRRHWKTFLLLGFVNNAIPFTLISWSQIYLEGGLASILNATTPLFALMLAHAFTRDERLNARKFTGVAIGIGGVAVLIGIDALSDVGGYLLAELASLGAAFCYGAGGVIARRRLGVFSPVITAKGQLWASTTMLLPIVLVVEQPWTLPSFPSPAVVASVLGLALLSTALGYMIYFRMVYQIGATNALLVTLLLPVAALGLGAAFLGESLTLNQALGMLLIFIGLMTIDGRLLAWIGRRGAAGSLP